MAESERQSSARREAQQAAGLAIKEHTRGVLGVFCMSDRDGGDGCTGMTSPGAWSEVRPGRGSSRIQASESLAALARPVCLSLSAGLMAIIIIMWMVACVCHLSVCLPGLVVSLLIHQIVNTKDSADDHHHRRGTVHPASAHRSTSGTRSSRIPVPSAAALLPCPGLAARPSWSPDGGPSRSLFPRNLRDPAGRSFRRLAGPSVNPNPKRQPRSGVSGVFGLLAIRNREGRKKS